MCGGAPVSEDGMPPLVVTHLTGHEMDDHVNTGIWISRKDHEAEVARLSAALTAAMEAMRNVQGQHPHWPVLTDAIKVADSALNKEGQT